MTIEEAKTEIMQIYGSLSEEKKMALDVLMAQADGEYITQSAGDEIRQKNYDLISRQAVLKELKESAEHHANDIREEALLRRDRDIIRALPSVKPLEKTGHWILARTFPTKLYDEYLNEYECSECYRRIRCTESQLVNYPYCHCGAKMVEPQAESDHKCHNCKHYTSGERDGSCGSYICKHYSDWESEDKE